MSVVGLVAELSDTLSTRRGGECSRSAAHPVRAASGPSWKELFSHLLQIPAACDATEGTTSAAAVRTGTAKAAYRLRQCGRMDDADALESMVDRVLDEATAAPAGRSCASLECAAVSLLQCVLQLQRDQHDVIPPPGPEARGRPGQAAGGYTRPLLSRSEKQRRSNQKNPNRNTRVKSARKRQIGSFDQNTKALQQNLYNTSKCTLNKIK